MELFLKMSDHKGIKNLRFSPEGLTTREIKDVKLCMLLITNLNISSFSVLDIKLWVSDGKSNISHIFIFIQIDSIKGSD